MIDSSWKTADKIEKTCNLIAGLDGCEPGDYLRSLTVPLSMAHYGNTGGDTEFPALLMLIWLQIEGMMEFILCDDPDAYGMDQEDVDRTMEQVRAIWQ